MDGNVIFDNSQGAQPAQPQQTEQSVQTTADNSDPSITEAPVQDAAQTTIEQPVSEAGTEIPTEAGGAEPPAEESPPPPPSGLSFLQNPLFKKILIGVGALFLLLIFIGIFIPKGKTVKDVTLNWWGLWEDQNVVNGLIADFEKQNPHIKLRYIKQDPNQYRDRLLTHIQNNATDSPDIFRYHNTWIPMLSNTLLPLSQDVITPVEFQKNYYPVIQNDLVQNGGIYGIPLGIDTLELFVNTDILQSAGVPAPNNWDDFYKDAVKLTVKDPNTNKIKTAGAAMGTFDNITHAPDILSLFFVQQGVNMQKFTKDTQNEIDALNFYMKFAQGDNAVWDTTLDTSILSFAKGNLAMYIGYSWDIFTIQQLNKNLQFKIYPIPGLYGNNKTIASYWAEGVSAHSQNQKEALLFMHYLAQKNTDQLFYTEASKNRSFGEPYARTDLAETLKGNALIYPFVQQAPNAASSFFASDTHDSDGGLNFVANNYLGNAVNSMIGGNSSTQSVVETLQQGVAQVLLKYGIAQ